MKNKAVILGPLAVACLLSLCPVNANAFSVWAVEGGAPATSNTFDNPLVLAPGVHTVDLFFSTEGDVSWGWDFLLDVIGEGTVSNARGGDIKGGLGISNANGGRRQTGGDPALDLVTSSMLFFTFDVDAAPGAILRIANGSRYTSGTTFQSEAIDAASLVAIQVVPVPAAAWLFLSGIGILGRKALRK